MKTDEEAKPPGNWQKKQRSVIQVSHLYVLLGCHSDKNIIYCTPMAVSQFIYSLTRIFLELSLLICSVGRTATLINYFLGQITYCSFFFFHSQVMRLEPRNLHTSGRCSLSNLYLQPSYSHLF